MPIHELKTWPCYFSAVQDGRKKFEYRDASDRPFKIGDTLWLREWSATTQNYSGRSLYADVTYVLSALTPMVILSIANVRDVGAEMELRRDSTAEPPQPVQ